MFTQRFENKEYTLSKIEYQVVEEKENLYLEFDIVEDIEFGVRKYKYGTYFNEDEIAFFTLQIDSMRDYVLGKLIELKA